MNENMKMKWEWNIKIKDTITQKEREYHYFNIIPTIAKTAFASQISGDNTTNIGDNIYVALWSNVVAPAYTDVQLWTETTRKSASSTTYSWVVWYIAVFFAVWEATWTHKEMGLFWDWISTTASWSANSWILYSHVAVDFSISATETLTTTFQITFSS